MWDHLYKILRFEGYLDVINKVVVESVINVDK
jgi:hypothetical protein